MEKTNVSSSDLVLVIGEQYVQIRVLEAENERLRQQLLAADVAGVADVAGAVENPQITDTDAP